MTWIAPAPALKNWKIEKPWSFMTRVKATAGRIPTIRANYLLVKNIEVSGLQVSDYRKRMPDQMAKCFAEIFALYDAGTLKPAPTTTYPLEQFAAALHDIEDRKVRGRIVLVQGEAGG